MFRAYYALNATYREKQQASPSPEVKGWGFPDVGGAS